MSKKTAFILIVTFLSALFLRYYNYLNTIVFDTDRAVVFLIADRITNTGKIPLVGGITSLSPINILPPTYFYLITFLFYFFRNETVVTLIFSLLNLYLIIVVFLISREMFSTKIALLASLFFTFSSEMVKYARSIWPPYTVPFFVVLTFYFLLIAFKRKKFIFLLFSIFFYFFSLMYVSPFLLFPCFLILATFITLKFAKDKTRSILKLGLSFLFIFLIFYGPVIVFEFQNNFLSLGVIRDALSGDSGKFYLSIFPYLKSVGIHMRLFANSVFLFNNANLNLFLLLLVMLSVIIVNFMANENYWRKIYSFVILILFLSAFLFLGTYQGTPYVHRLSSIYPFFFILFSYSVTKFYFLFIHQKKIFLKIMIFLPLLIISFYFINNCRAMKYFITQPFPQITHQYKVTTYINESVKDKNFSLYVVLPFEKSNYYSVEYWYILEKIRKERFVELNKEGNFIKEGFIKKNNYIFLICKNYLSYQKLLDDCLLSFRKLYYLGPPINKGQIDNVVIFTFKNF